MHRWTEREWRLPLQARTPVDRSARAVAPSAKDDRAMHRWTKPSAPLDRARAVAASAKGDRALAAGRSHPNTIKKSFRLRPNEVAPPTPPPNPPRDRRPPPTARKGYSSAHGVSSPLPTTYARLPTPTNHVLPPLPFSFPLQPPSQPPCLPSFNACLLSGTAQPVPRDTAAHTKTVSAPPSGAGTIPRTIPQCGTRTIPRRAHKRCAYTSRLRKEKPVFQAPPQNHALPCPYQARHPLLSSYLALLPFYCPPPRANTGHLSSGRKGADASCSTHRGLPAARCL